MRNFFVRDIYIRLADCEPAFVCTVKRSGFLSRFPRLASKTTEFLLHPETVHDVALHKIEDENALLPIKRWLQQPEDDRHPMGS